MEAIRVQANNLAARGEYVRALQLDRRLVRLVPEDAIAWYNLSCTYSVLGMIEPAFSSLRRSLELGYRFVRRLRKDPDLKACAAIRDFSGCCGDSSSSFKPGPPHSRHAPGFSAGPIDSAWKRHEEKMSYLRGSRNTFRLPPVWLRLASVSDHAAAYDRRSPYELAHWETAVRQRGGVKATY